MGHSRIKHPGRQKQRNPTQAAAWVDGPTKLLVPLFDNESDKSKKRSTCTSVCQRERERERERERGKVMAGADHKDTSVDEKGGGATNKTVGPTRHHLQQHQEEDQPLF